MPLEDGGEDVEDGEREDRDDGEDKDEDEDDEELEVDINANGMLFFVLEMDKQARENWELVFI
jgi:hypothetical protein